MTIHDTSAIRLQLLARGYNILPNECKACRVVGYNTPEFVAREMNEKRIAKWPAFWPKATSTGLRLDNLRVIDIDSDSNDSVEALLEEMSRIAPDVYRNAPTRFGGGKYKQALFCRPADGDEPFRQLISRKYVDEAGGTHKVEIFGGQPTARGNCSRQFGIYGPHSLNDDGTVAREYSWSDHQSALHQVPIGELPELSRAQAFAIVDAFEVIAEELGWRRVEGPPQDAGGTFNYDITDEMTFNVQDGPDGVSYEELCDLVNIRGEVRVSSSFSDGGHNRSKCRVSHCAVADAVGVFNTETQAWHLPRELAPPEAEKVDTGVGEGVKALAAELGVEIPAGVPNWPERYENGKPRPTLRNARLAILATGVVCSLDTFHNRMWMGRSGAAGPSGALPAFMGEVTDARVLALRVELAHRYDRDFTEQHVRNAVIALANENTFDPVVDMLAEAEASWDGVARLDRAAVDYFSCEDSEATNQCLRKTLIAAVARARRPGCKFDTILVMESPEGWNKSSAWALMAGEGNFSDQSILGHADREIQEQLAGVWIHENSELAGMKKAEVEMIKAFASRQVDRARPAYGRFVVEQPRHSIEVATTNSTKYLQSPTGNRRFWPVRLTAPIDLVRLRSVRLQLWGEAAARQTGGESLVLEQRHWKALEAAQESRRVEHPWEARIDAMTVVPSSGPMGGMGMHGTMVIHRTGVEQRVHTADIFQHVVDLKGGQMNRGHSVTLSEIMLKKGWTHKVNINIEGRQGAGYVRVDKAKGE